MSLVAFLEDRFGRGLRLAILLAVLALLFPQGRLYLLAVIVGLLFVHGLRTWRQGGWATVVPILVAGVAGFVALEMADHERGDLEEFLAVRRPIDLSLVPDGSYEGRGPGNNGPIRVRLAVADGKLARVEVVDQRDAAYAFDDVLPRLVGKTRIDTSDEAGFVLRNQRSLAGLQAAMEDAVVPAIFDAPKLGRLARAVFFWSSNTAGRITFNALAVLLIVALAFDYFLGPALRPGLGQSLNCYNCQACVGVCPVKTVGGDPFPLAMVLAARLGNLDRLAELSRYCVGCGKCAAKCPVGNSGPSIASSGFWAWREKARRSARRARGEAAHA